MKLIMPSSFLYILTNYHHSVFYTGVTSELIARISKHKIHLLPGFTDKYNVTKLVYYEEFLDIMEAINEEKQVKRWRREGKIQLIEKINPEWKDLYEDICS